MQKLIALAKSRDEFRLIATMITIAMAADSPPDAKDIEQAYADIQEMLVAYRALPN
jgi:hypothetical protein